MIGNRKGKGEARRLASQEIHKTRNLMDLWSLNEKVRTWLGRTVQHWANAGEVWAKCAVGKFWPIAAHRRTKALDTYPVHLEIDPL